MSVYSKRNLTKGKMKHADSNCTKNHKIRDHAHTEVTNYYGISTGKMKQTSNVCPICDTEKWKIELLHLLEIKTLDVLE